MSKMTQKIAVQALTRTASELLKKRMENPLTAEEKEVAKQTAMDVNNQLKKIFNQIFEDEEGSATIGEIQTNINTVIEMIVTLIKDLT